MSSNNGGLNNVYRFCLILLLKSPVLYRAFQKNIPLRLLGTRFKARNCISEPGLQGHFLRHPIQGVSKKFHVRLLGLGSKQEIALVNLVSRRFPGTFFGDAL
jgi:hypothetical protein